MSDERRISVWPWAAAVLLGLPVIYVASFGPACWVTGRFNTGATALAIVYKPITGGRSWSEETVLTRLTDWYAGIGAPAGWGWSYSERLYGNPDGTVTFRGEWNWEPIPEGPFDIPTVPPRPLFAQ